MKHENSSYLMWSLDLEFPFMGATPDGLVNCKCCNSGVLEKDKGFTKVTSENPTFSG